MIEDIFITMNTSRFLIEYQTANNYQMAYEDFVDAFREIHEIQEPNIKNQAINIRCKFSYLWN